MGSWNVYDKEGTTVKCIVKSLEYSESFMGECFVTFTMKSPVPIDFKIGDYLIYRGERFEINYDPTELKKSAIRTSGEAFVYDSVKLNSLSDELVRCEFRDYVPNDNNIHFSSLPKFSFYASSISSLAERIQVNLDRIYNGDIRWTVEVHPEYVNKADVNISVDNINVWEALALVNSEFGANFIIRGRRIIIGTSGIPTDNLFEYGKGNGLVSIQRSAESDQNIITRLRAYGSERNMPARYYNKLSTGVPNNMAVNFLMLPGFPKETLDPYIDSPNITQLGIREGSVFFDGSGDMEEIYPSIEGMTDPIQGALDEVVSAEQIEDDGTVDGVSDNNNVPPFTITLKDIGFDINDYLSTETASISMKSGMCGGREFEIVKCERPKNDTTKWILTCNRDYDSALKIYFPYNDYNVKPGDKFALLGIEMPDKYVEAASQKLLSAAKGYLEKNDYVRYTYEPKIDDVYMARQHDEAIANGEESIHDTIKAGDIMLFSDSDIMVDGSVIIDNLTIKEGDGYIPKYEVTLRNEKVAGTIDKIQNQIDSIVSGGQGSGGYNSAQIQSLIKTFGTRLFLRKDKEDIAREIINFLKGILLGNFVKGSSGAGIYKDENENWHIEGDYFHVRKKLTAEEVEIQRNSHIGGKLMQTAASMSCIKVEELEDAYRCYMRTEDAEGRVIYNEFKPNDQANVETFNLQRQANGTLENHFLWRLVTAVGIDYIELSKSICAEGSDIPQVGDEIVQLGYRGTDDSNRQNAQVLAGAGTDSPYIKQYIGINSFTLPAEYTRLKPGDNLFTGVSHVQPGSTGAKNFSDLPEVIQEAADGMSFGKYNLLRNTGFTGDFLSKQLQNDTELDEGSAMFSPPLDHWDIANVVVQDSAVSESGKEAVISSGNLIQTLFYKVMAGESYVLSFKAKGTSLTYSCGGVSKTIELTSEYNRYVEKFTATSTGEIFSITNATCVLCEIQLERGTVVSAWGNSMLDNSSELAYYESLKYLQSAIHDASSTTLGGLNLANIMLVGNYVDGKIKEITGGISGVYNDEDSVFAFGGGDLEAAIRCVVMFKDNPSYQPTDEELAGIAKIVLTHGGRAILNDVILRGYIYALGGRFQGEVIAESGVFKNISTPNKSLEIDEEGNVKGKDFELENVKASGTIEAGSGSKIGNMQILDGGATLGQNSSFINAHMVNIPYNAGVIDYSKTISGSITQFDTYLISNDMVDLFQMKLPSNDDIANSNSKLHGNGHTFRITIAVGSFYTNTSKSIRLVKQGNMDFYNRDGNPIEYLDIKNGMCVMIQGIINIVSSSRKILYSIL